MKHLLLRRRDSDALLDGHPLDAGADLAEVDAFLAEMRADFAALPAPTPRPTLAATLAGNLYDLGETTGLRLERIELPKGFRDRFERPRQGVAGTARPG